MTRKFSRYSFLSVVILFSAILMAFIALSSLAQMPGASQRSGQNVVVSAAGAGESARALDRQLLPGGTNGEGAPVSRQRMKRHGTGPMDGYPPLFLPVVTYSSGGSFPISVVVADVNGDGKPDLVVANTWSNNVDVLLGDGDGTFQPAVSYGMGGAGSCFAFVAVGDLNGDGKADIVVACGAGVSVLLGNGDGTFQAAVTYSPGGGSVAIGDVNGDGIPDLVVPGAVLLGNGDGTFQTPISNGSGGEQVVIADVNGDGKPDLVVAVECGPQGCSQPYNGGVVNVLLGNGDGTFQAPVSYNPGGLFTVSVAVADVNGDGKPDLAVGNSCNYGYLCTNGVVAVFLGNGDGTFEASGIYSSDGVQLGLAAGEVAIGDVNGDGKPDLLVTNGCTNGACEGDGTVGVLLGNGDGTFQSPLTFDSGGARPYGLAVGDLRGDGRLDLAVANTSNSTVGVLLNNTGPHPSTTTTLVPSVNPARPKEVVTYSATVTTQDGGAATGTVWFQDGGTTVAAVSVANNQAQFGTSYKTVGLHRMTAVYSGDLKYVGSTSATLFELVGAEVSTTTELATSGSPSQIGQPVTFTATVTSKYGAPPDGELVTFYNGKTMLGSAALAGGTAAYTTSTLSAGKHTIKATYAGDNIFKQSSGHVTQVVEK
jgi:hypothetical protein